MLVAYVIGFVAALWFNVALFHAHAVHAEPGKLDGWDWIFLVILSIPFALMSWLFFIALQSLTFNRKSFLTVVRFYSDYTIR